MTQYARPNSDHTDAEWRNAGGGAGALYQNIDDDPEDDPAYDDSDYIASAITNPMSDSPADCKIQLANTVTDPDTALSAHKVMYRAVGWDAGMMGPPSLKISLYDTTVDTSSDPPAVNDDGLIITYTQSGLGDANMSGDPYVTYTLALSSAQAAIIASYDDLQIWFKRQGGSSEGDAVRVSQAWFECAEVVAGEADTTGAAFLLFME